MHTAFSAHTAASFPPTFLDVSRRVGACTRCHVSASGGNSRAAAGVCRLLPRRRQRQVDGPPLRVRHDDIRGRPARLRSHVVVGVTGWQMVFACSGSKLLVHGRCEHGSVQEKRQATLAVGRLWLTSKAMECIALLLSLCWEVPRASWLKSSGVGVWGPLLLATPATRDRHQHAFRRAVRTEGASYLRCTLCTLPLPPLLIGRRPCRRPLLPSLVLFTADFPYCQCVAATEPEVVWPPADDRNNVVPRIRLRQH